MPMVRPEQRLALLVVAGAAAVLSGAWPAIAVPASKDRAAPELAAVTHVRGTGSSDADLAVFSLVTATLTLNLSLTRIYTPKLSTTARVEGRVRHTNVSRVWFRGAVASDATLSARVAGEQDLSGQIRHLEGVIHAGDAVLLLEHKARALLVIVRSLHLAAPRCTSRATPRANARGSRAGLPAARTCW